MSVDVEWDVADLTRQFLVEKWGSVPGSTGAAEPANIELLTENASGQARKGVDYTQEYILLSETGRRDREFVDGPREVVDVVATCQFEASTPESRERREAIWQELLALVSYARKRSAGTPGNWDTVDLRAATVDDEVFGWWALEGEWEYSAEARTV